jgi:hypothetical protein
MKFLQGIFGRAPKSTQFISYLIGGIVDGSDLPIATGTTLGEARDKAYQRLLTMGLIDFNREIGTQQRDDLNASDFQKFGTELDNWYAKCLKDKTQFETWK